MKIAVIHESIYGNTAAIAEAVAEGLRALGDLYVRAHLRRGSGQRSPVTSTSGVWPQPPNLGRSRDRSGRATGHST